MNENSLWVILDQPDRLMLDLANANKRLHWARKANVTRYWRAYACTVVPRSLRGRNIQRAHVTVWIRWPDARRRDVGNWAPLAKACLDGLVDARVLPDDNDEHVTGPDLRRSTTPGPLAVMIEIAVQSDLQLERGLR